MLANQEQVSIASVHSRNRLGRAQPSAPQPPPLAGRCGADCLRRQRPASRCMTNPCSRPARMGTSFLACEATVHRAVTALCDSMFTGWSCEVSLCSKRDFLRRDCQCSSHFQRSETQAGRGCWSLMTLTWVKKGNRTCPCPSPPSLLVCTLPAGRGSKAEPHEAAIGSSWRMR